ncbi:hypothetical protein ACFX2I_040827 [Malus domestica]
MRLGCGIVVRRAKKQMVNEQRTPLMVAATYVVKAQRLNNGDEVDTESHSFCGVVEINGGGVVLFRLHPGYGVKGPSPTGGPQGPRQNGHQDPTRIGPVCVRRSASRGFLKTPNKKCDPGPISLSRTLGRPMVRFIVVLRVVRCKTIFIITDASRVQSNHLDSISEMNALSQTSVLAGTVFRQISRRRRSSRNYNTSKDGATVAAVAEFEPSSVCLAKMVQNFIEESNEKQPPPKCGRNRCNCFHGNSNDSSDDELDIFGGGFGDSISSGLFGGDASDNLKSLIPCMSVLERNLLADTARIVEANKNLKQKDDLRKIVADVLQSLGYDSSTCKSK